MMLEDFDTYLEGIGRVDQGNVADVIGHIEAMDDDVQSIAAIAAAERCVEIHNVRNFIQWAYDASEYSDDDMAAYVGYEICRIACQMQVTKSVLSADEKERFKQHHDSILLMGAEVLTSVLEYLPSQQVFERIRGYIEQAHEHNVPELLPVFRDMAYAAIDKCNVPASEHMNMRRAIQMDIATGAGPTKSLPFQPANDPVYGAPAP